MNDFAQYISGYTAGKRICILGFGREGRSTFRILARYCSPKSIAIADLSHIDRAKEELPENVELICGETYQDSLSDFDLVFKSPGIVLQKQPEELSCTITSETQVFFQVFRDQIVGITGTKGKSTTSSLIYHIFRESGFDARLAGNIGIPVFDIAEDISEDTIVVCELSCHQLEYMNVSPKYAVFLNLYEEHLDHYGTMERYYSAKKNIYLHQIYSDELVIGMEIIPDDIAQRVTSLSSTFPYADVFVKDGLISDEDFHEYQIPESRIKLLGIHNHYNIAAAYHICRELGVDDVAFTRALCSFDPLAHRLEFVDTVRGIRWYDDSISTACATAVEALKSVPEPGTILLGGMDRGIDYTPLVDFLQDFPVQIICMETSGERIFHMLEGTSAAERSHYAPHLEEAVELAAKLTPEGKSCVLSPASASYGIFKNFEERGDAFKALVAKLK
ncbi:MAG: UDP-N-acetylmuramoyl-L-alanine--D-glutamate ligase [Ruminococcus sp.]|nr:UDP-N-acetylmuramoyl-L-alanine--D-glutamate ligase [Ruminococcus sp.]